MSDAIPTVRPDPRISRRRKAIERSRKKRFLVGVSFVALAIAIAWATFWSPLLHVRRVQVSGSKHVTGADIERAAHIGSDTNLLLLSTSSVVNATEGLPWVRHARVERSLPGTVRVKIVERTPVLVLARGSTRWLLDRTGFIIAPAHGGYHRLPTLAGVHVPPLGAGVQLTAGTGAGAVKAWRSLPPNLIHRVVAIFAPTEDAITLSLKDGTTVRYGPPVQMKNKNHVLLALLHKIAVDGTGASYIDVRVPTSPAVGPSATQLGTVAAPPTTGPTAGDTASAVPTPQPTPTPKPTPTPTPTH
jgi:cell division protein FtsQ